MRFAFIAKHRHIWPISWLCEVLEVSRSGFHAWLNRPLNDRAILDAKLVTAIDKSFKARDRTYGARRVWHAYRAAFRRGRGRDAKVWPPIRGAKFDADCHLDAEPIAAQLTEISLQ